MADRRDGENLEQFLKQLQTEFDSTEAVQKL